MAPPHPKARIEHRCVVRRPASPSRARHLATRTRQPASSGTSGSRSTRRSRCSFSPGCGRAGMIRRVKDGSAGSSALRLLHHRSERRRQAHPRQGDACNPDQAGRNRDLADGPMGRGQASATPTSRRDAADGGASSSDRGMSDKEAYAATRTSRLSAPASSSTGAIILAASVGAASATRHDTAHSGFASSIAATLTSRPSR